jgi:hypothetical protein
MLLAVDQSRGGKAMKDGLWLAGTGLESRK